MRLDAELWIWGVEPVTQFVVIHCCWYVKRMSITQRWQHTQPSGWHLLLCGCCLPLYTSLWTLLSSYCWLMGGTSQSGYWKYLHLDSKKWTGLRYRWTLVSGDTDFVTVHHNMVFTQSCNEEKTLTIHSLQDHICQINYTGFIHRWILNSSLLVLVLKLTIIISCICPVLLCWETTLFMSKENWQRHQQCATVCV